MKHRILSVRHPDVPRLAELPEKFRKRIILIAAVQNGILVVKPSAFQPKKFRQGKRFVFPDLPRCSDPPKTTEFLIGNGTEPHAVRRHIFPSAFPLPAAPGNSRRICSSPADARRQAPVLSHPQRQKEYPTSAEGSTSNRGTVVAPRFSKYSPIVC